MSELAEILRRRHAAANALYLDLLDTLTPDLLRARLPGVRSSPVSNQFWCVVGGRESHVRAGHAGSWQGFTCSLDDDEDPATVRAALERTAAEVAAWLDEIGSDDDPAWRFAVSLLEHETQHQGQLIRYFYAVPLRIPESWIDRYALVPE